VVSRSRSECLSPPKKKIRCVGGGGCWRIRVRGALIRSFGFLDGSVTTDHITTLSVPMDSPALGRASLAGSGRPSRLLGRRLQNPTLDQSPTKGTAPSRSLARQGCRGYGSLGRRGLRSRRPPPSPPLPPQPRGGRIAYNRAARQDRTSFVTMVHQQPGHKVRGPPSPPPPPRPRGGGRVQQSGSVRPHFLRDHDPPATWTQGQGAAFTSSSPSAPWRGSRTTVRIGKTAPPS